MHGNSTGLGTGVIGGPRNGALKSDVPPAPGDPRDQPSRHPMTRPATH